MVVFIITVAACEADSKVEAEPAKEKKGGANEKKSGTKKSDCKAYCRKQSECYPGAAGRTASWKDHCQSDCRRAMKKGGPVATFYSSVAACADKTCGPPHGFRRSRCA